MYAWSVYKHAVVAAFMLSVVKMLLKEEVGGCALNSHESYIADHGKSYKNHGIVFLNFCGNPDMMFSYVSVFHIRIFQLRPATMVPTPTNYHSRSSQSGTRSDRFSQSESTPVPSKHRLV